MGNPFSATSVNSYNANPPADDGSQVASNLVAWNTIKTKLPDPIKTAFDTSETATNNAFAKIIGGGGFTTTALSYTVLAADQGKFIKCTASGQTITTPDATVVGSPFVFFAVNESTGNITVAGNNPGVQQNIDGAASITLPAGTGCILNTDGTNWFTGGQNFANSTIAPVAGSFKNLSIKVASNTTVTVAADFVVLTNGSGKFQTNVVSSTVNLGTSVAVDALDIGTIAIDSWYYIWVIAKQDGTTKCVASLQSTSNATFLSNLAAIASGAYTFYARVGAVQTIHGSATLYGTWQFGRRAQYVVGLAQTATIPNIANGVAGTYNVASPTLTTASLVRFVPTTASAISVAASTSYQNQTSSSILVAPNTSWGGTNNGPAGSAGNVWPLWFQAAQQQSSFSTNLLLESTTIAWAASAAGGAISCLGWDDNI